MVHYGFSYKTSMLVAKGLFISVIIIFILKPILMIDMLGTKESIKSDIEYYTNVVDDLAPGTLGKKS